MGGKSAEVLEMGAGVRFGCARKWGGIAEDSVELWVRLDGAEEGSYGGKVL